MVDFFLRGRNSFAVAADAVGAGTVASPGAACE
jgi:hypothetical protein